ncbi:MAG: leucine-rich repeat domain-containing protein [Lachnospiraceae bacterium]|nr:leucine-rich repeat domain-containing protein [Lachnospiraceae bacterium]
MLRKKFTSVLLAAFMSLSVFTAPVAVMADETEPSGTETSQTENLNPSESDESKSSESSEPTETSQSEKFTVNRKESIRTVTGMCGDRAVWLLDNNGTLTVSGFGDMDNWESGDLVPWKNYKDSILAVVISSGVTSVGERAFDGCLSLETVNIAETVVKIGNLAFPAVQTLRALFWMRTYTDHQRESFTAVPVSLFPILPATR